MTTYTATITRDGKFWLIRVDGIGLTQARNVGEIEPMARDLVATWLDVASDSFELSITFAPEFAAAADKVAELRAAAQAAKEAAEYGTADAARELLSLGLNTRDTAALLGVSPGWVSVITKAA